VGLDEGSFVGANVGPEVGLGVGDPVILLRTAQPSIAIKLSTSDDVFPHLQPPVLT